MQLVLVILFALNVTIVTVMANIDPKQTEALLAGQWVNLGPVGGVVSIGSVPSEYNTEYQKDKVAKESAKIVLELARRMFPTGVFRMPPLDPYIRAKVDPVQFDHKYAKGSIQFRDVVVRGAKDFDLVDMRIRLNYPEDGTYRFDYNFTIPKLGFKSNFETNIMLGPGQVPLDLNGSIQVIFNHLVAVGAVGARKVPRHGYVPDQVQFFGLLGRGGSPDVHVKLQLENDASALLNTNTTALKLIYQLLKQELAEAVGKELLDLGNKVLKGFSVEQIHAALLHNSL